MYSPSAGACGRPSPVLPAFRLARIARRPFAGEAARAPTIRALDPAAMDRPQRDPTHRPQVDHSATPPQVDPSHALKQRALSTSGAKFGRLQARAAVHDRPKPRRTWPLSVPNLRRLRQHCHRSNPGHCRLNPGRLGLNSVERLQTSVDSGLSEAGADMNLGERERAGLCFPEFRNLHDFQFCRTSRTLGFPGAIEESFVSARHADWTNLLCNSLQGELTSKRFEP